MIKLFLLIPIIVAVVSCKTNFEKINDQANNFASNDKRIDQKEYETLIEQIRNSDERGFQTMKSESGEIDHGKVSAYLIKYFTAKGLALAPSDIWQPTNQSSVASGFTIDVFLENSASMDGYVNTSSTAFKATVLDLLTNLKNSASTDTLNLSYINSTVIPVKIAATKEDITDFYQNLNTANFRTQGGKRGSSDIGQMLRQILSQSDAGHLSVLVSDYVFSPGGKNAATYLAGQRSQIRSEFLAAKNRNPDLSVAILQGLATFQGTYYDRNDQEHKNLDTERPYYVWLIGSSAQIRTLMDSKILEQTRNAYTNKLVIQSATEAEQPNFKIQYRPRIGEFDAKALPQGIIADAQASRDDRTRGIFEFHVAVDFSNSRQDVSYFLDSTNYQVSNKAYSLKIKPIMDKNDVSLNGYSHILTLRTNELKEEPLMIEVTGKVPQWVYSSTSEDDTQIEADANEAGKTFGFSYLVEGVADAFYPRAQNNTLYTIPLAIKR